MWYDMNLDYSSTSLEDALVPPPHPVSRCDHREEAHVNQFRYPMIATGAYYCCCYKIVSINFFSSIQFFHFHHSFVNVIERRIHFTE
jgi:hypothetical protein